MQCLQLLSTLPCCVGTTPKQCLLGFLIMYTWPDGSTVHLSRELQSNAAASRQAQDAAEQSLAQVQAQLAALREQQGADTVGACYLSAHVQIKGSSHNVGPAHQTLHTVLCGPRYEHMALCKALMPAWLLK